MAGSLRKEDHFVANMRDLETRKEELERKIRLVKPKSQRFELLKTELDCVNASIANLDKRLGPGMVSSDSDTDYLQGMAEAMDRMFNYPRRNS